MFPNLSEKVCAQLATAALCILGNGWIIELT